MIQSDLLVLEQPMLFHDWAELDHVRARLDDEFRRKFAERGYVLLAWADVGEVHIFSKTPLRTRADLEHARVWSWVDDPVSRRLIQELAVHGVPLGAPDVLPSLERGLIDVCYGSPLAALAFQWHSQVRYMTSQTVSLGVGALVMSKRELDTLPPELQQLVVDESKRLQERITTLIREDDARALQALRRSGLQVIAVSPPLVQEFQAAADRIRDQLDGSEYGHDLRVRVERMLAEFRAGAR
jgi:TRAP-type C4-dicarboxylate transport system substrate-binding protein